MSLTPDFEILNPGSACRRERNLNQTSHPAKSRRLDKKSRGILPVLGLLGALIFTLSAPRPACAKSGNSFLETMGISIAVGTVLGASTLPFYDQPGSHLMNLAYGASLGAVAGIGIGLYHLFSGRSSDDVFAIRSSDEDPGLPVSRCEDFEREDSLSLSASNKISNTASKSRRNLFRGRRGLTDSAVLSSKGVARPALVWMPLVSLTW